MTRFNEPGVLRTYMEFFHLDVQNAVVGINCDANYSGKDCDDVSFSYDLNCSGLFHFSENGSPVAISFEVKCGGDFPSPSGCCDFTPIGEKWESGFPTLSPTSNGESHPLRLELYSRVLSAAKTTLNAARMVMNLPPVV